MQKILDQWDSLKKALDHSKSIPSAKVEEPKNDEMPSPHPDHMHDVKYGWKNIPGVDGIDVGQRFNIGHAKVDGKSVIVRHGAAAQRTDAEHQMAKLLGADHMVPDQTYDHGVNHPLHHGSVEYDPHVHGGTSFQRYAEGKSIHNALEDPEHTAKLREQWKNGDLHKLWALHYITNNADMHAGNFKVGKDGVKAFDSDHAFYEVPTAHIVEHHKGSDKQTLEYQPGNQSQLPSYIAPFVGSEHEQDEGIDPKYHEDQVAVKELNDHAKAINPDAFQGFSKHAAERAAKVKKALMSSDPTVEMHNLWNEHRDRTGEVNNGDR